MNDLVMNVDWNLIISPHMNESSRVYSNQPSLMISYQFSVYHQFLEYREFYEIY